MIGSELIFISRINRDGSGTTPVTETPDYLLEENFVIHSLSITNKTYIACGFNSYVVKLKKKEDAN